MRVRPSVTTLATGAALLLGTLLSGTAARAAAITCSSTTVLPGGNGYVLDSLLTAGACVQTIDALFGNFNLSSLPAGGSASFNVTNFGSPLVAYHGLSFNVNFVAGNTYTAAYSVLISSGSNLFASLNSDFTQNNGTSTLTTTTSEAGTGTISFTKNGTVAVGPDLITYSPPIHQLDVVNTLVDNGSVSALANNAVENAPVALAVPEPGSLALFAAGLAGLFVVVRRVRRPALAKSAV